MKHNQGKLFVLAYFVDRDNRCSRKTVFHGCKLLKQQRMMNCRSRVHFAGSVVLKKVVTRNCAMFTRFSTEAVESTIAQCGSEIGEQPRRPRMSDLAILGIELRVRAGKTPRSYFEFL
jgi:hypothetical protein